MIWACFCLLLSFVSGVCYDTDNTLSSPVSLTNDFKLQWKTLDSELYISLSLSKTTSDDVWMGFGFPEQTSGSMAGSDVVTIRINENGEALAEDRYVGWAAFPYYPYNQNYTFRGVGIPTSPSFLPQRDCENNGTNDWIVLSSSKTNDCQMVAMKRKFKTEDSNDRDVPVGLAKFIWALGYDQSSIQYHGGTFRGTDSIEFIPSPIPVPSLSPSPTLMNRTFTFNGQNIPQAETSYHCLNFWLNNSIPDVDDGVQYDIVGFEPVIHPATKAHVHHIVFFACSANIESYPPLREPYECFASGMPQGCSVMLFTWELVLDLLFFHRMLVEESQTKMDKQIQPLHLLCKCIILI